MVELKCVIKKQDDQIGLSKSPTIFFVRKGGPKKQSPMVLQFLIKDITA